MMVTEEQLALLKRTDEWLLDHFAQLEWPHEMREQIEEINNGTNRIQKATKATKKGKHSTQMD